MAWSTWKRPQSLWLKLTVDTLVSRHQTAANRLEWNWCKLKGLLSRKTRMILTPNLRRTWLRSRIAAKAWLCNVTACKSRLLTIKNKKVSRRVDEAPCSCLMSNQLRKSEDPHLRMFKNIHSSMKSGHIKVMRWRSKHLRPEDPQGTSTLAIT